MDTLSDVEKTRSTFPKTPGIYRIRNKVNGKMYIGSAVNLKKRLYYEHLVALRNGTHFSSKLLRAWKFHGEGNFVFEVLEVVEDKTKLIEREQYYLDTFLFAKDKIKFQKLGYNTSITAGSNLGLKFSLESRELLRQSHKGIQNGEKNPFYGRKHTEETRKIISRKAKGRISARKGVLLSEETKEKIREARKLQPAIGKTKVVLQLDLMGNFVKEWASSKDAAISVGGSLGSLCRVRQAAYHRERYLGYLWSYKEKNYEKKDN